MLIPRNDMVVVLGIDDPDTWYDSKLIVRPESTKDRCDQGIVKAVGPNVKSVQVGDYVMFSPYSGMVANVEGEGDKCIIMKEEGVIAILTPPTTPVPGLFVRTEDGYIPATSESAALLLRRAYHEIPRVAQIIHKWEHRHGA